MQRQRMEDKTVGQVMDMAAEGAEFVVEDRILFRFIGVDLAVGKDMTGYLVPVEKL